VLRSSGWSSGIRGKIGRQGFAVVEPTSLDHWTIETGFRWQGVTERQRHSAASRRAAAHPEGSPYLYALPKVPIFRELVLIELGCGTRFRVFKIF